jgi:hypothetical protein
MSFNLKQEEGSNKVEYQKPGVYDNVVVTEVVLGKSSFKKTTYIELKTLGQNGEVGKSNKMYLSTVPSGTNTVAAWDITKRNIGDIVLATNNLTKQEVGEIELVPSNTTADIEEQYNMLAKKVASLVVGKPFRAKFKGEQNKEGGIIFSTLDKVEHMNVPKAASGLRFNEQYDIKLFKVDNQVVASAF